MELHVVDSHTEGEPTRLVIDGLPSLEGGVKERLAELRDAYDWIRRTICLEPRGSEVAIGAALFPPSVEDCLYDVVFMNNTGYLGMCGHGTIGVIATLAWLGRIQPGEHKLNTVAGIVKARLHDAHTVSFENVFSYRLAKDVSISVPGHGVVTGDVAYGGNWFFLVKSPPTEVVASRIPELEAFTSAVMDALWGQGVTGKAGAKIDHIEVFGPPTVTGADSKNYVLCPGKQHDRSPCGTGTSAKLACLFADGKLAEGEVLRQESIIGSLFEGSVRAAEGGVFPTIKGRAYVTGDCRLLCDQEDPFRHGIGG